MSDVNMNAAGHNVWHGFFFQINCLNCNHLLQTKLTLALKRSHFMNVAGKDFDELIQTVFQSLLARSFECLQSLKYCLIFIESTWLHLRCW